jgi:diguanylate cyclase (GGDEF)-like protein
LNAKPEVGRSATTGTAIGEIARFIEPVRPETKVLEVDRRFKEEESLTALPVVTAKGTPKGLVVRELFFRQLSRKFGYDLYGEKPIEKLMDSNPVIMEKGESLERTSRACLERPPFKVYDPFIIVQSGKYVGLGTVYELFRKTSELQILYATYANPLTGLPGNIPIYDEINRRILTKLDHAVVYADLDNFKAYNDRYGFPYGDDVIKYTALTLKGTIDPIEGEFLGHVGGDDFIFIVPRTSVEAACEEILAHFDASIANFYNEEDRLRGFIVSQDREGQVREFCLMALSMAGVLLEPDKFKSYLEVGEEAARLKKIAKKSSRSCFVASWCKDVL